MSHARNQHLSPKALAALAIGAVGVVFGDIGTSPLYALKESFAHLEARGQAMDEVYVRGLLSLVFWLVVFVVNIKYIFVITRASNRGEGGIFALLSLIPRGLSAEARRGRFIMSMLAIAGAGLLFGDGIITPSISVLSAMEGLEIANPILSPLIIPLTLIILIGLFYAQQFGTARIGVIFGPVMVVWFSVLAIFGVMGIAKQPDIISAVNPMFAVEMIVQHPAEVFFLLGSVVLCVTGAEALYADMGHFGKRPIQAGWLFLVLPALVLNYLGQGALVLAHPEARGNPFFDMIPVAVYWPVLLMATAASVIASQAVITGAFSMTQQAVQLGLLPRMDIRRTSETQAGQIYVPQVNTFLMIGVIALLFTFQTSSNMAAAYGIAVTGSMFVDTLLFFVIIRYLWKKPLWMATLAAVGFGLLDIVFISSNMLKLPQGAWLPLVMGALLVVIMWTWNRGTRILGDKTRQDSVALADLSDMLLARPPHRASGSAVFLTSDPDVAPVALMHNLKHNKVLHERNIILTVITAQTPRVRDEDRIRIEPINADFKKLTVSYGFMESPNIPRAMTLCRQQGLKFDIMATSFFLGRRSVVASASSGMPLWQDKLFIFLMRNAANPTDFYKIPPGRVVELGTQVTV